MSKLMFPITTYAKGTSFELFKYRKKNSINNIITKQPKDHASSCLTKTNTISPLDLISFSNIEDESHQDPMQMRRTQKWFASAK